MKIREADDMITVGHPNSLQQKAYSQCVLQQAG